MKAATTPTRHGNGYWRLRSNQVDFFNTLARKLNLKNPDDWYKISRKDIVNNGGTSLLMGVHRGSMRSALSAAYPDHEWLPWKFSRASHNYWKIKDNQRRYMDWMAIQLNIRTADDWYAIKTSDFEKLDGYGLLLEYKGSIYKLLASVFPEYKWQGWKFNKTPFGFFDSKHNQKQFMDWIGNQLELKDLEGWYGVTGESLLNYGGKSLLTRFNWSLPAILTSVYPDYHWQEWQFQRISKNYWNQNEQENVFKFIHNISETLQIAYLEDWYRVSVKQLIQLGGRSLVRKGGLCSLLKQVYPQYPWNLQKFNGSGKRSRQRWLRLSIAKLFPTGTELLENYQHPDLKFSASARLMELDIYVPAYKIAFEYQGEHHFKNIAFFGSQQHYNQHDSEKKEKCVEVGITLFQIPYWWDGEHTSLKAIVGKERPELFTS